jgi:hypothetical protein
VLSLSPSFILATLFCETFAPEEIETSSTEKSYRRLVWSNLRPILYHFPVAISPEVGYRALVVPAIIIANFMAFGEEASRLITTDVKSVTPPLSNKVISSIVPPFGIVPYEAT